MATPAPHYPDFFDAVPRLRLRDPLAELLGASEGGLMEYAYADAVRLAGHSCPTVASAYWMSFLALERLYGEDMPERGAIRVAFRQNPADGVTGVIANVVSLLTGAAQEGGFKGLGGRFDRRNLLTFGAELPLELRFTRLDTGASVDIAARPQAVPAEAEMMPLMRACLEGSASPAEGRRFGTLWQDRVRRLLLEHGRDPEVFVLRSSA
jgi:hypothetical protein